MSTEYPPADVLAPAGHLEEAIARTLHPCSPGSANVPPTSSQLTKLRLHMRLSFTG